MRKEVCVIDDDKIYQLIIRKVIERTEEFEYMRFYDDAVEAFEAFKDPLKKLPGIILLDINMPQMDGWQFLEDLVQHRPNLYLETNIYIVSSSIAHTDREKAESYKEVSGFLSKPLSVEKLKNIAKSFRE